MDYKNYIEEWILNFLSQPQKTLNGFPPCPFAKKAYLENKVNIIEVKDYVNDIIDYLNHWDDTYEVVVFVCDNNIDPTTFVDDVSRLNQRFMPLDIILLEDHIDIEERIQDLILNNGKYNLILAQRTDKLNEAAEKLHKTDYYQHWPKEYYEKVVAWRTLEK